MGSIKYCSWKKLQALCDVLRSSAPKKEGSMSLSRSFVVLYIYFCELSDRFLMNIDCVYVYNDFLGYMLVGIYPVMEISLIEREYI